MALAQSPGIVTNGLQFYYDMSNVKKSWLGMPTTNQFTLPSGETNGFGVQNSTFTRIRTGTYGGYVIQPTDYVWRYNVSGNDCPYHGWDIPTTSGAVVTFSFDYYVDPSTANYPVTNYLANFENAGSGVSGSLTDPTPSVTGVWKRGIFSSTATATGNSRCLLYPGACGGRLGDSGFILYKNPQVEFNAPGSNPTPFVAGTRYANSNLESTPSYPSWNTNGGSSYSGGTLTFAGGSYSNHAWDLYKTYSGLSTGTNYTWSALVKMGTASNMIITMNNTQAWDTGPSTVVAGLSSTDWTRVSITGTTNSGSFNLHLGASANSEVYSTVQSAGTVYIQDVRLQLTQSQTSLVDVTGQNTLAATSLTYNTDGTFNFNGSNSLTIPSTAFNFNTAQTIIIWMKNQSPSSARRNPYNQAYAGGGTITHENDSVFNYYFGTGGGDNSPYTGFTSSFSVVVNETAMICITRDASTVSWYKNGAFSNSISNPYGAGVVTGSNNITIGSGYAGAFVGSIYAVQLYNRALTASEVAQNFNALRGRYGI